MIKEKIIGTSSYRASISRPQEWFNRSWSGHKGRVESFLRPKAGKDKSPLEELVGETITPENTSFYVCGWQGTVDGVLDSVSTQRICYGEKKKKRWNF